MTGGISCPTTTPRSSIISIVIFSGLGNLESQNITNTSFIDVHVLIPEFSILRPQVTFLMDDSISSTDSTMPRPRRSIL